jgi:hypothetical protein
MNTIAIAIKINERQMMIGAQWPTSRTLKSMVQLKLARLKRRWRDGVMAMAEIIIPLPSVAAA